MHDRGLLAPIAISHCCFQLLVVIGGASEPIAVNVGKSSDAIEGEQCVIKEYFTTDDAIPYHSAECQLEAIFVVLYASVSEPRRVNDRDQGITTDFEPTNPSRHTGHWRSAGYLLMESGVRSTNAEGVDER